MKQASLMHTSSAVQARVTSFSRLSADTDEDVLAADVVQNVSAQHPTLGREEALCKCVASCDLLLVRTHPVGVHGQQLALQADQVRRRLRHLRRRQLQRRRIVLRCRGQSDISGHGNC